MIRMPWSNTSAPNVMIEVVDTCNVSCKICYRNLFGTRRSLDCIRRDLDDASGLRQLHTVTITGGEPTLHPELCTVVSMIKERGLHAFLLTNGLLIDQKYLARLKDAGLDSILFHVDQGQKREDLPKEPTFSDVQQKLDELIGMAASFNIDASISTILYEEGQERAITDYFLQNKLATFLFLSKAVACNTFFQQPAAGTRQGSTPTTSRVAEFFRTEHDLEPFAYIPTMDGQECVWISYFVPVIYTQQGYQTLRYRSTWMDAAMMRLVRALSGRYIHKTTQNRTMTLVRIFLNAVSRMRFLSAMSFWARSRRNGNELRHKTIVYDDGPYHGNDKGVQHCEYCPTAIVRDGALVPCCTADYASEVMPA